MNATLPTLAQQHIDESWKDGLRKQSSQFPGSGPAPDDQTMAKAFMDQAYTHVANKAGRLMEDSYRLGFEIVKKNEATSKILAIFAFRVGRELLYVPVFFLNGMIRGTDLLHRYTPKRFVPLTPDWAAYLIEQATTEQGASIPRSEVGRIQDGMRMDRIVWPPMQQKFSSADIPEGGWEKWVDELCEQPTDIPLHAPEYMAKSAAAFQALIDVIDESPAVADLLLRNFPEEHFFPEPQFAVESIKQASAPAPLFKVHRNADAGMEKAASAGYFDHGYWIEDNRPMEKLARVEDMPIQEGVMTVGMNGRYGAILYDGDIVKALVGTCEEIPRSPGFNGLCEPCGYLGHNPSTAAEQPARRVVALDGSSLTRVSEGIEIYAKDIEDDGEPGIAASDMKAGSVYCLIYPGGGITSDFLVRKVESGKNGLKDFIISESGWDTDGRALVLNPETSDELCQSAGVINDKYRAIKLKAPTKSSDEPSCSSGGKYPRLDWSVETAQLGDPATVNAWLFGTLKLRKASAQHDPIEDVYQLRIEPTNDESSFFPHEMATKMARANQLSPSLAALVQDDRVSEWLPRIKIATKIAGYMQVPAAETEKWLDAAVAAKGRAVSRILEYPETAGHEKQADFTTQRVTDEMLPTAFATDTWVTHTGSGPTLPEFAGKWGPVAAGVGVGAGATALLAYMLNRRKGRPDDEHNKKASLMPIQNKPPYELQGDPVHRLPVEYGPQTHILNGQRTSPPDNTRMQIGEVYDPARGVVNQDGDDFIFHMQPEELAQMSVLKKMPHVLDHGVIGSMASMYDASSAMDPLLNDMERGLDATGRAIFLMLWKPIDFRNMYGADDMPDLENKLTSIFKGLGDLLLDLLKKNNSNDAGSPPVM